MRVTLSIGFSIVLLTVLGPACGLGQDDFSKKRIVYSVPGMDKVIVQRGLQYTSADKTTLPMDVYVPPGLGADERRPAVILIHGGPIEPGMTPHDWGVFRSYGELLAASGLVAVTFTHRLYGAEHYTRSAGEVRAVIETVRTRTAAFHVDAGRIALWAFSGGGPLVSVAFANPPDFVKAVCSYYAILDFEGAPPVYKQVPAELSPLTQLRKGAGPFPPILLARAGLDEPFINQSVDAFVAAAVEKKLTLDLLTLPTGHHAFDIRDDEERSRQVIKATVAFLKAQLGVE
jgi:dipeptidyl aminopeptidase/acylaminoacyl peptidase